MAQVIIDSFKKIVLKIVKKIPAGKFLTYKEVAKLAGNEKAYRVVGNILMNHGLTRIDSRSRINTDKLYPRKSVGNKNHHISGVPSKISNPHIFVKNPHISVVTPKIPNQYISVQNPYISVGIPCHRVIRNDYTVGDYLGRKDLDWLKAALLLKEGAIGVIPTDTIYGICTSALNKNSVEKVYKLRKRNPQKPCIILISSIADLNLFKIKLQKWQREILEKIWPGRISVVLPCKSKKFSYLHRGTKTLALRLPKDKLILKILKISGPLIAPSANWEGYEPAKTINEAKKYFGNKVFYLNHELTRAKRKLMRTNLPSTLIDLTSKEIKVLRKGADYYKIKKLKFNFNNEH